MQPRCVIIDPESKTIHGYGVIHHTDVEGNYYIRLDTDVSDWHKWPRNWVHYTEEEYGN